jgi:hypothetical protein
VKGFDVTGVVSEVDLTFPEINGLSPFPLEKNFQKTIPNAFACIDACDCIQACLDRPGTCAAYVYKFSTGDAVLSGHRTCTLCKFRFSFPLQLSSDLQVSIDSQFNLPANVTIEIDVSNENNTNINGDELVANGNNPQAGAAVSMTFMDFNLNSTQDNDAVSG